MNFKILTLAAATTAIVSIAGYSYATETKDPNVVHSLSEVDDGAPVTINGTVGDIRDDEFDLVYRAGVITVELDRFGWSDNATKYLTQGENVTVRGYIDDDFFEGREIEAKSVNLNDNFVYYYSQDNDLSHITDTFEKKVMDGVYVNFTGRVKSINGKNMTIKHAHGTIPVDVSHFTYDPFDNSGAQKIDVGDYIFVYGQIDDSFFKKKELIAEGMIELKQM